MSSSLEKEAFLSNKEYISLQHKFRSRSSEGDCYGASGLAMEVVFTKKVAEFNAQSRWLKTVATELLQLSPQQRFALYGFLDRVQRNQDPYLYRETLKQSSRTYTQDLAETMNSSQSADLEALGGLCKVGVVSGFYDFAGVDIERYFSALKAAVEMAHNAQRQIPFSLIIMNCEHAIYLGYRPAEDPSFLGTWFVFEINPRFIIDELLWNDSENVISFLTRGLLPEKYRYIGNIAVRTEFYSSHNNEEKALALQTDFLFNLKKSGLANITADKIYKKDMFEVTWFEMAIKAGDIDTIRAMMLMVGPGKPININSLNSSGKGILVLGVAVMQGHIEIVRLLLEWGIEISNLPEILAFSIGGSVYGTDFPKILALLIQYGAEINSRGSREYTALMSAAENGRDELVQFLLDKGASLALENKDGYSALRLAAGNRHHKVVKILLHAGADVNWTNRRGESMLMLFIEDAPIGDGYIESAKALIAKVKDVNLKNKRGLSALELAVAHQCIEVAALLIQKNAQVPDDDRFWDDLLRGLGAFMQKKGPYFLLVSFETILEKKLEAFIARGTLKPAEKQCLIKLYIVLCHIEKQHRLNQGSNGSNPRDIQFFPPDTVDIKTKTAIALLKANDKPPLSEIVALKDDRLQRIAKLFAGPNPEPSTSLVLN